MAANGLSSVALHSRAGCGVSWPIVVAAAKPLHSCSSCKHIQTSARSQTLGQQLIGGPGQRQTTILSTLVAPPHQIHSPFQTNILSPHHVAPSPRLVPSVAANDPACTREKKLINSSLTPPTPMETVTVYDEIEIEDFVYDPNTGLFQYPCPCGDKFAISLDDLRDGEDIAVCPSCSLMVRVIFEEEDLDEFD